MPHFGVDNVRVSVRSIAPIIQLVDREQDIQAAKNRRETANESIIPLRSKVDRRHSLAIYDRATGRLVRTLLSGEHVAPNQVVSWDGLDNRGIPTPAGDFEWRSIDAQGLTARYITTIGINPAWW